MRLRMHPNDVNGGDSYYFGLFEQTTDSIQSTSKGIQPNGGTWNAPATGGYSGTFAYGASGGGGSSQLILTSSLVDCTYGEVPPLQTSGSPVYYASFILYAPQPVTFQNTSNQSILQSSNIQNGALYDVYWYDVTNVSPSTPATLLLHTSGIQATAGVIVFPTVFTGGLVFDNSHTIVAEVVKD